MCASPLVNCFALADLRAMPWKNGGGTTREIVSLPEGAGPNDFDWRVSVAQIASSGPFSRFAGVDRIITLLDGDAVRLHTPDGAVDHLLDRPLKPFGFSGEAAIEADLLGSVCEDFNVMTRRAGWSAEVMVLRNKATLLCDEQGLLFAVRGHWRAHSRNQSYPLPSGSGLWWQKMPSAPWKVETTDHHAALLAVRIHQK